jgi:flagellar biogenesis protein FliO
VSHRGSLLEVLDSTSLGPNRAVYVVRAGGKRLVLGVTQNQITALGELDERAAEE